MDFQHVLKTGSMMIFHQAKFLCIIGKHPLEFVAAGEFMKISKLGGVNILLKKDAEKLKKMI